MTAPKIDTQAPERIGLIQSPFGFALAHRDEADTAIHYVRADLADLSAAREAAAAQAMREAAIARAKDLPISEIAADEVVYALEQLPAPDPAALDRLIAERVREARAYAREAIIHAINDLCAHLETYHDSEEESREAANLRHIWHHLEGTLIGMDEADAARGSKEGQS